MKRNAAALMQRGRTIATPFSLLPNLTKLFHDGLLACAIGHGHLD